MNQPHFYFHFVCYDHPKLNFLFIHNALKIEKAVDVEVEFEILEILHFYFLIFQLKLYNNKNAKNLLNELSWIKTERNKRLTIFCFHSL